jgi:uncharacterized protein (DUF983 family)
MPDPSGSNRATLPPGRDDAAEPAPRPRILPTVWRGVRRRCPHCGRGPLFIRWITLHRRCADCGLVYLRNQGDIWFFWIVMDRIPILAGIAAIFFGFRITTWLNGLAFFLAVAGPLVATMPQRQGAAVALNYLSRVYFRDPSDALPEPADERTDTARAGTGDAGLQ